MQYTYYLLNCIVSDIMMMLLSVGMRIQSLYPDKGTSVLGVLQLYRLLRINL